MLPRAVTSSADTQPMTAVHEKSGRPASPTPTLDELLPLANADHASRRPLRRRAHPCATHTTRPPTPRKTIRLTRTPHHHHAARPRRPPRRFFCSFCLFSLLSDPLLTSLSLSSTTHSTV